MKINSYMSHQLQVHWMKLPYGCVMDSQILSGLFNNSALLLSMCLLYDTLALGRKTGRLFTSNAFSGFILGAIGVAVMVNPWQWYHGIIFDTRSILLCVSGLFFGEVPTIIAMGMTSLYRLHLGGSGALMGVSVILASGTIGIIWRHRSRRGLAELSLSELYGFGVVVHFVMLTLMALLPGPVVMESLVKIGIPVMLIYPVATALLGKLMVSRQRHLRFEEALRKSEERFTYAMDATSDGLWDWDIASDSAYFSPGYYRMLGYCSDEFPTSSESLLNLVHPDDRGRLLGASIDCIENRVDSFEVEFRMREKRGGWRWILGRGKSVSRDENGKALRVVGTHLDITERKMAEERLREGERMYRQLFELESDAIFIVNAETGEILEVNQTAATLYGYTREELLSMKNVDLSAEPEETSRATADKLSLVPIRMHKKRDGTVFPVEITASHFFWKGKDVHLAAIRDISERIRAEEERKGLMAQLSQSQKMEAVGQLAGGIAHDFNNILTVIFGYAHIILSKIETSSPLHHPLEQIVFSATRAADLTHGLLAFSRKQILSTAPLDLGEVVMDTENMLRRLVREDIDFRVTLTDRKMIVNADRGQMGQVLINLVTNAVDAMPDGGMLSIDVGSFVMDDLLVKTSGYGRPGSYASITVTDSGCGMDAETEKKVFEPFFTTKEVGKGTGLGLSIVYGIVKQHDGFISVESGKNAGTKFHIFLPLEKTDTLVAASTKSHALLSASGRETILLAEDDKNVRSMNAMAYEDAGYRVIEAVDGEDAVAKFLEHMETIDLLVFDVIMPRKDGKTAYEEIRKTSPDMKVLFMSGYTKDIVITKGVLEEEVFFISKPFKPYELLKLTRDILDCCHI
jgi:two-component system cell cycle sensor histidine kinase/response regulator CckA